MQAQAIFEAAVQCARKGIKVIPEVMIPLVGDVKELQNQKKIVVDMAEKVFAQKGVKVKYMVGTMIEVPRGALTADEVAKEAEFFSFGTNDLTQTTFGFSATTREVSSATTGRRTSLPKIRSRCSMRTVSVN